MEIGPITGIRTVSLLGRPKTDSALPPAFQIDASARTGDDAYSAGGQTPDRGLEEEDSDLIEERDAASEEALFERSARGGINFIA